MKIQIEKGSVLTMANIMGDRIYLLRKQNNMTQTELGTILGVGRSAVLKYEKDDDIDIPSSKVQRMAEIFGVSPSYLMGFDKYHEEDLADEVKLIEKIQAKYGKDAVKIMDQFMSLNNEGRKSIMTLLDDIASMPKYQKEGSR